jgi:hypothetical protein
MSQPDKVGITNDRRKDKSTPIMWAVATDRFLSGWGHAPDKSYIAYAVHVDDITSGRVNRLFSWMRERGDFIRVRTNINLPRLRDGCHLSVNDIPEWIE